MSALPKTYNDIFHDICSFDALYTGYVEARKGKRYKQDVLEFSACLEENLLTLSEELREGTYEPRGFERFTLYDPKRREVFAPRFRDRVVHRALNRVLEPLFRRKFIHDTYACLPDKGTHAAVDRLQSFMRKRDSEYYLQCDVSNYFDSVRHDTLMDIVSRTVKDDGVLWLVEKILDAYHSAPGRGLPIGTLYSQLFSNVYLNPFDHFVKQSLCAEYYIRYMDDFILLSGSRRTLTRWREAMQEYLDERLGLDLPDSAAYIEPVEKGATFLGYRVFPYYRLLRRRNTIKFKRTLREHRKRLAGGETTFREVRSSIDSWLGHVSHADTYNLRRSLLGEPC